MGLSKESKSRVLENFYSIDYLFFGKSVKDIKSCCPLLKEEYLTVKGALLSVMIEMYKLVDHSPKPIEQKLTEKMIFKNAKTYAKLARTNSVKIVNSEKGRDAVKEMVKEAVSENKKLKIKDVVKEKVTEKTFNTAVDNLLIARMLTESKNYKNLNSWEGRIIEDAYKVLRSSLVESALTILNSSK